ETPGIVAEPAVELGPASPGGELADLRQAGRVPRLGDQLRPGQHGVFGDVLDERRVLENLAVGAAPQDRRQVEAKAVDVQLGNEVSEAVDDQVADDRV